MAICDKIKEHRIKNDLTQRELGELIGVSVQAISKWERGNGVPDFMHIKPLATALHISTDELLDFHDRLAEINDQWLDMVRHGKEGTEDIIAFEEKVLNEYPDNHTYLYRLAIDLEMLADKTADDNRRIILLERALYYINRLHYLDQDDNLGCVSGKKAIILSKLGRKKEALAIVMSCEKMASDYKSRLLKYCLEGDELLKHRQRIIRNNLCSILTEMDWSLEVLEMADKIIDVVFQNGRYNALCLEVKNIRFSLIERLLEVNDIQNAIPKIEKYINMIEQMFLENEEDKAFSRVEIEYTTPIFSLIQTQKHGYGAEWSEWLAKYLDELSALIETRNEEEFVLVRNKLNILRNRILESCNM